MRLLIFRPTTKEHRDTLHVDDDFWDHSHAAGPDEFTICGMASEEWGYEFTEAAKKITCPECIRRIRWAQQFKL